MPKQGMLSYEQKKNRLPAKKGLTTCTIYCIMQTERPKKRYPHEDMRDKKEVVILKSTNKHTGANTGTLIYSERASGEVISYKLHKEEINKLLKNKD